MNRGIGVVSAQSGARRRVWYEFQNEGQMYFVCIREGDELHCCMMVLLRRPLCKPLRRIIHILVVLMRLGRVRRANCYHLRRHISKTEFLNSFSLHGQNAERLCLRFVARSLQGRPWEGENSWGHPTKEKSWDSNCRNHHHHHHPHLSTPPRRKAKR